METLALGTAEPLFLGLSAMLLGMVAILFLDGEGDDER